MNNNFGNFFLTPFVNSRYDLINFIIVQKGFEIFLNLFKNFYDITSFVVRFS